MSPTPLTLPPTAAAQATLRRLRAYVGHEIRELRLARRWTVDQLAAKAGLSRWVVYLAERGDPVSLEAIVRLSDALNRRMEIEFADPRRSKGPLTRSVDPVHAAMGEFEIGHFRPMGLSMAIDEPYQHYQFAGRADVVAWELGRRALLHIENRTQFPDLQETAGSFNAKRAYLGRVLAERIGIGQWRSETHVMASLWSSEVLHTLRLRTETFRALCPDDSDSFASWWNGDPPDTGRSSCLVVLDPLADGRHRPFVEFEAALKVRPRYRGYADAASAMMDRGG